MRNFKFITTLRFLEVLEEIPESFSLMPGIDLINDRNKIQEIINDELKSVAGTIEHSHLLNSNHLLICEADETIFQKPMGSNEALFLWLVWIDMLINDSWLVKDNAMACEIAYAKMTDGKHTEWSNNYLAYSPSFSSGEQYVSSGFTNEEIIKWESLSHSLQSYLHDNNSGAFSSFINKGYSRIGRAFRFIYAARKEPQPAIKISHYCTAFESLFSTDNTELSHKLSERIALFLKPLGFDPLIVFDDIKLFYNVRSKVTHGDNIQPSKELEIPKLSSKCDAYLRSIVISIIKDNDLRQLFDGNKQTFDEYFKKQMFGIK